MKAPTAQLWKNVWGEKGIARLRAARQFSSAPNFAELQIYQKFLRAAIAKSHHPQVLVLGATPELRDLAIQNKSRVYAVDISPNIIYAMNRVMRYPESEYNVAIRNDWLKMDQRFPTAYFDVVLGDVCLNNLPPPSQVQLLKILHFLLKKGGYFFTRNVVFPNANKPISIEQITQDYYCGRNNWLGLIVELGYHSPWFRQLYDPRQKRFDFQELTRLMQKEISKGKIQVHSRDRQALETIFQYIHKLIHYTFPQSDFEKMLRRYFYIRYRESSPRYTYTRYAPIYFLQKRT